MNISCLLQWLCPWSCDVNIWKFYHRKEKCDKTLLGWLDIIVVSDKSTCFLESAVTEWNILSFKFIFKDWKCLNDWQLTATQLLVLHYTHPSFFGNVRLHLFKYLCTSAQTLTVTLTGTHDVNKNTTWIEAKVLDYLPAAQTWKRNLVYVCT